MCAAIANFRRAAGVEFRCPLRAGSGLSVAGFRRVMTMPEISGKMRLDKWLWAARFFKTRALAATAVDGGKVQLDGQRAKPAREVKTGALISIRRTDDELELRVRALSQQRRGAPEAALLYEETEASRARRKAAAMSGQAAAARRERGAGRPTKRQRRELERFFG